MPSRPSSRMNHGSRTCIRECAGWVEQLDVNTTGEMVTAGQPLARIFSQELLSSQTEYLAARRNTAASGICERGDRQRADAAHRARDGTGGNRRHRADR